MALPSGGGGNRIITMHGITLVVLITNAVTVSLESDEKTCLKRSNK